MKKEILINTTEYETRVAILEDDKLVELQVERPGTDRMVGDIYKGKIKTVLPGMQAAFVDIGMEKAAYLHSSDIGKGIASRYDSDETTKKKLRPRSIRKTRRAGIETVLKTESGNSGSGHQGTDLAPKGRGWPRRFRFAGRYLVLVPDDDHVRVSKRITDWGEKKRLRKVVTPLRPEGFGLIIRTEAEGSEEREFAADIKRLLKLWAKLKRKADTMSGAGADSQRGRDGRVDDSRRIHRRCPEGWLCDNRDDYKKMITMSARWRRI